MKWLTYNLLFTVVYIALLPSFLLRMKRRGGYRERMGDRFGRYPDSISRLLAGAASDSCRPVWIHAVSVGEVQVAGQLMRAMRKIDPAVRFVFSTTSSTGWKTAESELERCRREGLGGDDVLIYNPIDFRSCVRRAFDQVRPRAVILTETEIWPNFILEASRRGIPLYLVNARVSDRSAPRYRALRWFFGDVLRRFSRIYVQSDLDADRLAAAGADRAALEVTGSVKFDVAVRNPAKEGELARWIAGSDGVPPPPILLGGSTWPGEDGVLLGVYSELLEKHPEVRLVIAPRHFEKADAVEANILASGFTCIRRSRGTEANPQYGSASRPPVYLCDTTGEMMGLFGICEVAFVGKSLCAHGSQNMIEPCLCGKPTLVGPYTENFRPVMSDLLAAGAILQVSDAAALKGEILRLFDDVAARRELGDRARSAVERRRGATDHCARELLKSIASAPPPAAARRLSRRAKWLIALGVVCAYAIAAWFATPFVNHGWRYLRLDSQRRYSSFVGLSAATAALPWCLPAARKACGGVLEREKPGEDEFGVRRFAVSQKLLESIPSLFPGRRTRVLDARRMTMAEFARELDDFESTGYWLWCVGRWDYLVVARLPEGFAGRDVPAIPSETFFATFSDKFKDFAAAGVYSPAELLCSSVGCEKEIKPAFAGFSLADRLWSKLPLRLAFKPEPTGGRAPVRASCLTSADHPNISWLKRGGTDAAVFLDFQDRVIEVQGARRRMLLGFDDADRGSTTNALEHWSAAARANRSDPLVANLADSLDLEGRRYLAIGNVNGAIRCYENRLLVRPADVAAVHNFGVCLKKSGHPDMAASVFARAVEMAPRVDEHRLELIECCAASHHEDIACRQLDVLIKRHPEDPSYKIRAARLLALESNPVRDIDRAIALAEEAVKMTRWKDRAYVQELAEVYIACGRTTLGLGLKKKIRTMKFDK